jgi:hypothetical protein
MGAVPALSALREHQGALHNFHLAKFISFRYSIFEEQRAVSVAFLRCF